jgi:uncharacterized protein HemX
MADSPSTPPPSGHRALSDRLAETPNDPAPAHRSTPPAQPARGRAVLVVAILVALAAVVVGAGSAYIAWDNRNRAADWEERAFRLERNTEQLNGLLVERSTQLNERTRELNALAGKVTRAQSALARSESDVESLSTRQRELAAEKAAVEDSRAELAVQSGALEGVADTLLVCNSGLFELFEYVLAGDRTRAEAVSGQVASDCELAETRFAQYRFRYG